MVTSGGKLERGDSSASCVPTCWSCEAAASNFCIQIILKESPLSFPFPSSFQLRASHHLPATDGLNFLVAVQNYYPNGGKEVVGQHTPRKQPLLFGSALCLTLRSHLWAAGSKPNASDKITACYRRRTGICWLPWHWGFALEFSTKA